MRCQMLVALQVFAVLPLRVMLMIQASLEDGCQCASKNVGVADGSK
ncbi:hypothetical protein HanHA300_Chr16g0621721 [Helianthus annuus]|nr:hypothetical protein HanHA300_Chr16g0621721 [Helianthus annuus]KAJ0461469.1 hypothetical protein HanHA89_Chr16g0672621 [Helianthus annuus]